MQWFVLPGGSYVPCSPSCERADDTLDAAYAASRRSAELRERAAAAIARAVREHRISQVILLRHRPAGQIH